MTTKAQIQTRLEFWKSALEKMQDAYLALISGGVKSYRIDDRQLTRFDIPDLLNQITEAEQRIDELMAMLNGQKPRKAFGVILRDW